MNALQAAVEAIGKAIGPTPTDAQLITEAKAIGLIVGYDARWRDAEWRTVSTEEVFQLPIVNPSTQRASRTFTQAGKFDGIVDYRGKNYLLEHKCVHGDSIMFDYRTGLQRTASEISSSGNTVLVLGLSESGKLTKVNATVKPDAVRSVYSLKTKAGRTIKVSNNHPMLTRRGWIKASDLLAEDELATPIRTGGSEVVDISDAEIKFVAYMIGDGSYSNHSFTKLDETVLADFCKTLDVIGCPWHRLNQKTRAPVIRFSSASEGRYQGFVSPCVEIMSRHGMEGTSASKIVPPSFFGLSDRQIAVFLGALWTTDGCIDFKVSSGTTRICYSSRSKVLCQGIQVLLLRLGLWSTFTESSISYKGTRRPYYSTKVVGRRSKRQFLSMIVDGQISFLKYPDRVSFCLSSMKKVDDPRDVIPDAEREIFWDDISSIIIEPVAMMYDVSVPGVHNFVANDIVSHNTTSDDISDPNGPYWRRLAIDSQVSSYVLANWQAGRKVEGTLYDVIRKPGIRPKEITKIARTLIVADGAYCGHKVTMETRTAVANGQDRECPELYRLRLAAETLAEPDKYFQRRVIPRLDGEVLEWADELWDVAQDVHAARTKGRFYRNSDSCMSWGRPCEYLGICSGYDTPDSDKWKRKPQVHVELPVELPNRGLAVLTNSSVKTFQCCRRKFQYRYDLGLERQDDEEVEALYLGNCLHAGLRAWFDCFPYLESTNDCPTGSAAIEVAQPTDGPQIAG